MTPANLTRLRELCAAAITEWRVADPATGSFCMYFDRNNSLRPEQDARDWLDNHRKQHPGGRHAHYEVKPVEVKTELQHLATELLAMLGDSADTSGSATPAQLVTLLQPDDHAALERFDGCLEDSEGHDVPKDRMRRLQELGVVQHHGFGRCSTTAIGSFLLGRLTTTPLATRTDADKAWREFIDSKKTGSTTA